MSDQHSAKRQLLPSKSFQTTAEKYAEKHGIPADTNTALSTSVAMRIRQNIAMGYSTNRTLQATQSLPVALEPGINSGFMTGPDTIRQAEGIINLTAMRYREVQPYSSLSPTPDVPSLDDDSMVGSSEKVVDALSLSPRGEKRRVLRFSADGQVEEIGIDSTSMKSGITRAEIGHGVKFDNGSGNVVAAKKRRDIDDAEEDEGEITETDDDPQDALSGSSTTLPRGFEPLKDHGFPAVFTSPQLSQPQLFSDGNNVATANTKRGALTGRPTRGLPGRRALGKAVSAPVGSLWGGAMDVDGNDKEEDGFDTEDWAKSQNESVRDWANNDNF